MQEVGAEDPAGDQAAQAERAALVDLPPQPLVRAPGPFDSFAVPTLYFGELYVFFVIKLDTREVIAWNVTDYPTDSWTARVKCGNGK